MVDNGAVILKRRGGESAMWRRGRTMTLVMITEQRDGVERRDADG
jgi:hypothetical protein